MKHVPCRSDDIRSRTNLIEKNCENSNFKNSSEVRTSEPVDSLPPNYRRFAVIEQNCGNSNFLAGWKTIPGGGGTPAPRNAFSGTSNVPALANCHF